MPKAQMPCGMTSGMRRAELSCASNSALSSQSCQAAQAVKVAKPSATGGEQVKRRPHPRRQPAQQHVHANVGAPGQGVRQRPG
jgi:hypothetical protein